MTTLISENISRIREEIARVCRKVGRDPREITLVAVTKFAPVKAIQEALDAGVTDIAENKVQEGLKKYPLLKNSKNLSFPNACLPARQALIGNPDQAISGPPTKTCLPTGRTFGGDNLGNSLKRHLIGHLQTNKVKDALKIFDLIQSVDSLKLAEEIEKQSQKLNRRTDILVQVNISGEEQKFGADKEGALKLISDILKLKNIQILGLMTMAPLTEDQKIVRDCFKGLRELRDLLLRDFRGNSNFKMKYLSMGMSGDFAIALEEGSNMVRVGSAIFRSTNA